MFAAHYILPSVATGNHSAVNLLWRSDTPNTKRARLGDKSAAIPSFERNRHRNAYQRDPLALLRDIAKAQKHGHLAYGSPQVTVLIKFQRVRSVGAKLNTVGGGTCPEQVVVDIAPGRVAYVEGIVSDSLAFLEAEMATLGV